MRQYDGPPRPASEIAVLIKEKGSPAVINQIDGKFRGLGDLHRHEFAPGSHVLAIEYVEGAEGKLIFSRHSIQLKFFAEADHTYELMAVAEEGMRWRTWIKDVATGEIVSEFALK